MTIKKKCKECPKLFNLGHPADKYCSEDCRRKARNRQINTYRQENFNVGEHSKNGRTTNGSRDTKQRVLR